ncbi:UNVERIFIED_CONTAM: hypothetical protein PYX00_001173 [Menopon gallinae]|uniref:CUB domain-containing protein n=1 Tax=Menopon gallinae TaxID=328185 RepID=A0AAW2ID10_9NEOP
MTPDVFVPVCNVTLDSRVLSARSGKTFGQIKSPSIQGPGSCFYVLLPGPGQRVEVQIYRLISVGRFNGTGCQGGFLQLVDGAASAPSKDSAEICGVNDRYAPPVLLFADNGPATLIFKISEPTVRSQFLAYFSFTSMASNQGIQSTGGRPVENSECDWLYQDFTCRTPGSCILTSPGFPGLYPPNTVCKYHIAISSIQTRVKISFASLLLPQNRCSTDYIAVYQGTETSSPQLTTLCGNRRQDLTYFGPNLLLEFRSGVPIPPYDYNGFKATLEFSEKVVSTESSVNEILKTTETDVLMDRTGVPRPVDVKSNCDMYFSGVVTRSGTFDVRSRSWGSVCTLTFVGRPTDVIHVSLFNYILKATSCQSGIEIYDGLVEEADTEFLDGAYLFHDEQIDGTLKPSTLCDVDYYGMSSPSQGQVSNPGTQDLYFNIERALKCVQRFIPASNQSVTLTVSYYQTLQSDPYCHTQCGDGGCLCVTSMRQLSEVDHLLLQTESGQTLSCLCGEFQVEWLPVTLQSWSPLRLVYSIAHYSWERKGFNFTANYTFTTDGICGHQTLTSPDGEIESVRIVPDGQLNYYYHQKCTWLLDTKIERQLNLELYTAQNRHCSAWNVTIHHYDESADDRAGALIETFCPRQRHKKYTLPWKTDLVVVSLQATTHTPPEFTLRWRSRVFRSNNRIADPSPTPGSAASRPTIFPCSIHFFACFLSRFLYS